MITKTLHMIPTDYSTTWPERIYLYSDDMDLSYENQTGRLGWSEHNLSHHKNIEYVRADLVNELLCNLKGNPSFKAENSFEQDVITPKEMESLYKNAKHQEPR